MGHNLTYNSRLGEWEVMTRGAAWHHLGQVVQNCQTWVETMRLANMEWTISKRQLEYNGDPIPAWGIFRDDLIFTDPSKAFLSATSESYEMIQNQYMFAFLDTMLEADGKAHYEAAGSLNGGAQVFALVNLGSSFEIGKSGDRFENYLCFTEDRTGKKAAKCFITSVRVVCANTFEQAYSGVNDAQAVKFRHTKSITDKMADAAGLFTGARMDIGYLQAKLERLAERQMTKQSFVEILDSMFPAETEKQRESKRREDRFKELIALFDNNDDNQFPETKGTAYNLFNAVTEYTDHFSPVKVTAGKVGQTDQKIRSERALFGTGAEFKGKVLDLILDKTQYNPIKASRTVYDTASRPSGQAVGVIELEAFNGASILDAVIDQTVAARN